MAEIFDLDVVADNNNQAPPNGFPEGMAPSAVNNSAREFMAIAARAYQAFGNFPESTGTSTAMVLTLAQSITAYAEGQAFTFRAGTTNGVNPTLNVNGVGAVSLVNPRRETLTSGLMVAGAPYIAVYNGTQFVLMNVAFTIGTTAGDVVALDGSSRLPAVDARNLTALNATQLTSGTISPLRYATNSNAFGTRVVSTSPASGNALDGTIWYQYI